jgi:tetratricopeptide (TPR) repeat protein
MRQKHGSSLLLSRLIAGAMAASLATTSLVPLGRAQGAPPKGADAQGAPKGAGAQGAADTEEADAEAEGEEATPPTQEELDAARDAFNAGRKAFDEEDYEAAEGSFKEANDILPAPAVEFWYAKALDKQEAKEAEALAAYRAFLSNPKADAAGETEVAEAKQRPTSATVCEYKMS